MPETWGMIHKKLLIHKTVWAMKTMSIVSSLLHPKSPVSSSSSWLVVYNGNSSEWCSVASKTSFMQLIHLPPSLLPYSSSLFVVYNHGSHIPIFSGELV